jgi:hypothetical protein
MKRLSVRIPDCLEKELAEHQQHFSINVSAFVCNAVLQEIERMRPYRGCKIVSVTYPTIAQEKPDVGSIRELRAQFVAEKKVLI